MFLKIPVNVPFWSNVEDESRIALAEQRRDVIKDALGSTIRRPGLSTFCDTFPDYVSGIFYWQKTDLVYAVCRTGLYSLSRSGVATLIESGLFGTDKHVSFAESPDLTLITSGATRKIFITNGGEIVEYDGTTAAKLTDAQAPVKSTHIAMFDSYLLSNELDDAKYEESILYSDVANPTSWAGAYFTAENKPDNLNAIHQAWDEVALFGKSSIENFYDDGSTPFKPIPGAVIESGTLSPWTIKLSDSAYFYLNSDRRVVRLTGRQAAIISQAIDDVLEGYTDFANAEGEFFSLAGRNLYLLTINNRTFVYDTVLNEWVGEWCFWDKQKGAYNKFKGRAFLNVKEWGITLCVDKEQGIVYQLSFNNYTDSGDEIRSSVITGNIDHGTGKEKRSNELRLRLKRGFLNPTETSVEPKMLVRWRDNGSKLWSNWRDIMLGYTGDGEFYYSIYQLGSYRARQYEFTCSDNVPFSIVDIEEDVVMLR